VELIAGTRIPVSFHFGGILDAYTSSFWRSNSNHDSYSAVLRRVEDGPFSGQYVLRTAYSGYGITDQQTLNLETGALAVMHGSYSDPEQTRTLAVPRAGEDPLPYVRGLNALEYALSFVATPGRGTSPFLQYPMLEPARGYVTSVFRTVLETNGPILKGPAESPALIAGLENSLALEVASEQERDLLVDLFVDGRWAAGARGPVQAGYAELSTPSFEVPSTVTRHMSGVVYLKLVPTGADWTKKVAEVAVPVTFRGPELLSWYIVSDGEGNEVVAPGAQVFVSGSIRAERVMDVRVDLFHPDGRWLSGAQGPTNSIPEWENTYNFEIAPVVPDSVPSGTQLTVITKVLPPGGLWSSYVDQSVRGIMVR
jgi:hypothetical protein